MRATRSKHAISAGDDIRERHRKRQLKKKRVRFTVFCICMALLVLLVASAVVFLTPWFHVAEVRVSGNSQIESATLIEASEIKKGESIFAFSMGSVEEKLLKVPYVKTAGAKRKLPKTVIVEITESRAVAYIQKDNLKICIDNMGEAVSASAEAPEGLISVAGMEIDSYTLGEPLVSKNPEQTETLMEILRVAEESGCLSGIHSVDITREENISFTYGQGLTVLCGDTYDLPRKILTFIEIKNQLPENAKGEIDLRIDGRGYYRP